MNLGIYLLLVFLFLKGSHPPEFISEARQPEVSGLYDLTSGELSPDAFQLACQGYQTLLESQSLDRDTILTIIDYSKPSHTKRMFVFDMKNRKLLFKSLVAHGQGSGEIIPCNFSNQFSSHKSSLGFFITGDTYLGKHGYSLRINGIETGINNNAKSRAIVFHGASYVSTDFISKYGRLGRSFGCPALPPDINQSIIDIIKNASCVFIYAPDQLYLANSTIISSREYCQKAAE